MAEDTSLQPAKFKQQSVFLYISDIPVQLCNAYTFIYIYIYIFIYSDRNSSSYQLNINGKDFIIQSNYQKVHLRHQ